MTELEDDDCCCDEGLEFEYSQMMTGVYIGVVQIDHVVPLLLSNFLRVGVTRSRGRRGRPRGSRAQRITPESTREEQPLEVIRGRGRGRGECLVSQDWNVIKSKLESFFDFFINFLFVGSISYDTWNHSTTNGPRTNNHLEGFHAKVNRWLSKNHPSVYTLIKFLKELDSNVTIEYNSRLTGTQAPVLSKNLIETNNILEDNLNRLKNSEIDLEKFLDVTRLLINFTY
ncbi:unnamed protein product [Brachionus calyciflorus]|uniref:Uncharacterized protein n=1 Tax=Brachionus calyciflorus TaxID=104777 RepID=A0A814RD83_9BILA|nr:unnamed protein product [Brachionus calyciflorus]